MSPTRTFSQYAIAADGVDNAVQAPLKRSLKIFALWRHELAQARTLAQRYLQGSTEGSREVVFARLVNDRPLSADELADLSRDGVRVVPVSSRYKNTVDGDRDLQKVVLERLRHVDRLLKFGHDTLPPEIDAGAACAVREAYARMPSVTPMQRQEFLDEYYAADQSDNSVG